MHSLASRAALAYRMGARSTTGSPGSGGLGPIDGPAPLAWSNLPLGAAIAAGDYTTDQARWNSSYIGGHANIPGWSNTSTSAKWMLNQAGVLVQVAANALKRTDKGLLVEGARTNLCLQSQTFDNASWVKSGATTVTANTDIAPDGTTTADTINNVAAAGDRVTQDVVASATASHVFSCFLKAGPSGLTTILLRNSTTATNIAAGTFTLSGAGSAGAVTGTATIRALGGGWYFCSIASSAGVTAGDALICYVYAGQSSGSIGHTAIVWGAQLEAASFPSSYIPTTTASVTRAADVPLIGSVTGLDYPLTLYAEFERDADTGAACAIFLANDGDNTDEALLFVNASDVAAMQVTAGNVAQAGPTVGSAISTGSSVKMAGRAASNSVQMAKNGLLAAEDTSATAPAAPTNIYFGTRPAAGLPSHAYLKRWAIFPRALSDAELTAITT